VAGKGAGGDEGSGTRSSLMDETLRIVEKLKPEIVIWENVKNLWGKKHRHNWENYVEKMGELGYDSAAKIINARDCGIPQNRERLFTVSIKRGSELVNSFMFPEPMPLEKKLKDMLEDEVDEKCYLSEKAIESLLYQSQKQKDMGNHFEFKPRDIDSFASCISTRSGQRKTDNFIRVKNATRGGIWMLMMEMELIVRSYQAKLGEVEFSTRWRRRFQRLRQLSESMIRCASESSLRLNAGGSWASKMKILGKLKRYAQRASYISKLGIVS
jgi:site-specific DNA-cytosine methylase